MSDDPELEQRIDNKLKAIAETQKNLQEAIAQLVHEAKNQRARSEGNSQQTKIILEAARRRNERGQN